MYQPQSNDFSILHNGFFEQAMMLQQ